MELTLIPNEILREKCSEILPEEITEYRAIAEKMIDTMVESGGIGLAGPQVGIAKRIVVFFSSITGEGNENPVVMINPKIIEASGEIVVGIEGCLSVPGISVSVARPSHVHITALNAEGKLFDFQADGIVARCALHEIDHLDGITIVDRLDEDYQPKIVAIPKLATNSDDPADNDFPFVCFEVENATQVFEFYNKYIANGCTGGLFDLIDNNATNS